MDISFWAERGLKVEQMSVGPRHGAVIDNLGALWAWSDAAGPVPRKLPCRPLVSIASTDTALYAVTRRGSVLQWTELADAIVDETSLPTEPRPLAGALKKVSARSVAAGRDHVLVVGSKGELVALGDNERGQLGLGDEGLARSDVPTLVPPLPAPVSKAACGASHSVLLLADGSAWVRPCAANPARAATRAANPLRPCCEPCCERARRRRVCWPPAAALAIPDGAPRPVPLRPLGTTATYSSVCTTRLCGPFAPRRRPSSRLDESSFWAVGVCST